MINPNRFSNQHRGAVAHYNKVTNCPVYKGRTGYFKVNTRPFKYLLIKRPTFYVWHVFGRPSQLWVTSERGGEAFDWNNRTRAFCCKHGIPFIDMDYESKGISARTAYKHLDGQLFDAVKI